MNIGIIGTPGSGKSKLAEGIAKQTGADVIDGYADDIADELDVLLGDYATHTLNLIVATDRIRREMFLDPRPFITCGTIVETIAYASLIYDRFSTTVDLNDREQATWLYTRTESLFGSLGLLMKDNWPYDVTFYLPNIDNPEYELLDYSIREFIKLADVPVITLTNPDEYIEDALKGIEILSDTVEPAPAE